MSIDWQALKDLRQKFLNNDFNHRSYWTNKALLEDYDQTFAQRISWKWQRVLSELHERQASLPTKAVSIIDWGCGTGIASRSFLSHYPEIQFDQHILLDKSLEACHFAAEKIRGSSPSKPILINPDKIDPQDSILLISHVLNELKPNQLDQLVETIKGAAAVIWVENGTKATSRKLTSLLPDIRENHQILAPCVADMPCPMNKDSHEHDWCHNFARIPKAAAELSLWGHFKTQMNIDTRSAPYSFVVAARRGSSSSARDYKFRALGRPQILKGHVKSQCCSCEGLTERSFSKSKESEIFKALKKQKGFDTFSD